MIIKTDKHVYRAWNVKECLLAGIILFVQLDGGQIISLVLSALFSTICIFQNPKRFWHMHLFVFFWMTAILIMLMITSNYTIETWIELTWLLIGIFVIVGAIKNKDVIGHRIGIVLVPTVIVCLANLVFYYQIIDFSSLFNPAYAGTRIQGGFDGPNEIGAFLTIVLTYIWTHHVYINKVKFIIPCTVVILYVTILTWSRGAFITLAIATIIILVNRVKNTEKKYRAWIAITSIVLCIVGYYLICNLLLPELEYVRRSATDRDNLIEITMQAFLSHPILGQGFNSFRLYGLNVVPHSSYFLFIVSGGLVGITALLYMYFSLIKLAWRKSYMPEFWALFSYYIFEQGFNNIVRGRVLFLFLVLVIFLFASQREENERNEKQ